jgi:hypothetical protein
MTVNSPANHLFEWGTEELAPFLTPPRERWRSFGVEVSASVTVPLSGPDREQAETGVTYISEYRSRP